MTDLFEEVKELESAMEHSRKISESYKDTEQNCASAVEHRRLAGWLEELLEIKKARLSLEVFFHQQYNFMPDDEEEAILEDAVCFRCKERAMMPRGEKMICSNCGAVRNNK